MEFSTKTKFKLNTSGENFSNSCNQEMLSDHSSHSHLQTCWFLCVFHTKYMHHKESKKYKLAHNMKK